MPTPYAVGHNTPATGTSQVITITGAVALGDCIIVLCGSTAAASTVSTVTDSQSNAYSRIVTPASTSLFNGDWFICKSAATALTVSDTITVTFGAATGTKTALAIGVPGVTSNPVDQGPAWVASASTTAPSVTTGTLSQATEIAIGGINSEAVAGAPTIGSGFTQISQVQSGASPFTTLAYKNVSSTAAVTFSATMGSAAGAAIDVVTLLVPAAAAPVTQRQPLFKARPAARPGKLLRPGTAPVFTPAPFFPPRTLLKGNPAARRGRLTSAVAPPVPPPSVPAPFFAPRTLLRGRPAARPGKVSVVAAPPPVIHPSVPAPFFAPHSLLKGAPAARRGRLSFTAAPPPAPAPPPVTPGSGIPFPGDDKRLIRRRELRILGMRL